MLVRNLFFLSLLLSTEPIFSQVCPQANAGNDVSICPAGGSVTIGTPAVPGATYFWSPSIGLNNTGIAQPIASPNTTTTYTLTLTSGQNLLSNGDFESGYTGFSTDYVIFPATDGSCGGSTSFGSISVNPNPNGLSSYWCNMTDHSSIGVNMLSVDGTHLSNRRVWFTTVPVIPNSTYSFSGWSTSNVSWLFPIYASRLRFRINGVVVLQDYLVPWLQCQGWGQFSMNWFSGASTTALIEIFDDNLDCAQNDFSLDDLSFTNCPATIDQVTVCVCQPPPPPQTVTVQISMSTALQMAKFDRALGVYCFDQSPTGAHYHNQYLNECGSYNYLMSGYMQADNNLPSSQAFEIKFMMDPKSNGVVTYLDFAQNNLSLYEYCLESDILDARLKFFHKVNTYPICDRTQGWISEFNLLQPHSGSNAFTVKRTAINKYKNYCLGNNYSVYNIDNPPQATSDIITVPPSITPNDDYTINVTQMVKNSLNTNTNYLGFLVQQVQSFTYNNILFQAGIDLNNDIPDPGEPYIELTYIRRPKSQNCNVSKTPLSSNTQSHVKPFYRSLGLNSGSLAPILPLRITLFPNPTDKEVVISSPNIILEVEIFNMSGSMVKMNQNIGQRTKTFATNDLIPGLYVCRVITDKGTEHLKFVVQR